ncbi:MAG: heat shock protein Hsp70 [Candidatus Synechococcus spongiarum 142]|uniref:Heat shock protein Hsp70 n=1 Tax=Candidatus Synechococcus spongiarum 142 TaxID=1608213 RepID=A0A6N3XCC7_9SYNE|nr:MAG: heat shock protein Hsp70 [Candidatus Synechococcus spongiarum 142]
MKSYIGIDLGTTNSAICSYEDGRTRIWKSPEQNDVTPSAIYIGKRDRKFIGIRAYNLEPKEPGNVAMLFKRVMGTSTPIKLPAVDITMTPEECSSEILRTLLHCLPEELREALRNDPEMGTVITVPAVFDQMKKTATMQAAEQAGIGKVALMQEPVAAVMHVMKARNADGTFLIYDLGGGTLDITLAESGGGHVNILALGGIEMCGGRDFDRRLVSDMVEPWLRKTFDLPGNWPDKLRRMATWAAEQAKIELSSREEATIYLLEGDVDIRDQNNQHIYIDVKIDRNILNKLIHEKVDESIKVARETLDKAGLSPHDVDHIVFIGGPTHYKPLRDQVSSELGIAASTEVNPMTAVAEGAALFAESIDWGSENRSQKSSRGTLKPAAALKLNVNFNYNARTPSKEAKIIIQAEGKVMSGTECQVESLETGWKSGLFPLKHGETIDVPLFKDGENEFKVSVFDDFRGISTHKIVITRTAATVDAIPASRSIGLVVLDKLGGSEAIEWCVQEGDHLPKKQSGTVKAAESLKAGSTSSLNFKLVEGETDVPKDNRFIGVLKIKGTDLDDEAIPAGADLDYDFEMRDSGEIVLKVSVPCIGYCSDKNFYSHKEGQIDYSEEKESVRVSKEGERMLQRLVEIERVVDDRRLEQARSKLKGKGALYLDGNFDEKLDPERVKEASEEIYKARCLMDQVRKDHRKPIRQLELNKVRRRFNEDIRQYARPSEENAFDNLTRTAQRSIDRDDNDFESHLSELKSKNFAILWRQDWYVIQHFKLMISSPPYFSDQVRFQQLVEHGKRAIKKDDIDELRQVVRDLYQIWISTDPSLDDDVIVDTNIIRG